MSERETWIDLIRNEYEPRPNYGKADYPGFEWDDGAGRIADAILADRGLLLRKHGEEIKKLQVEIDRLLPYAEAFRREENRADKLGREVDEIRERLNETVALSNGDL